MKWYAYIRSKTGAGLSNTDHNFKILRLLIFSRLLQFKKKKLRKIVTQKGLRNEEK